MKNVSSNEDIRHRWNGHHRNTKYTKHFKKEAGCCGRIGYILCGDIEKVHGRSKLDIYSEYVEVYYRRMKIELEEKIEEVEEESLMQNQNELLKLKR